MRTRIFLVMALLCLQIAVNGQILNKKVSVSYTNLTIGEVLKDLTTKHGVRFSYSSNYVPLNKKVSLKVKNSTVQYLLKELFKGTGVTFEEVGVQVVLKKASTNGQTKKTGESKSNSSVKNTLESAVVVEDTKDSSNPTISAASATATASIATEPMFFEEPKLVESPLLLDTMDRVKLRKQYLEEKRSIRNKYYSKLDSIYQSSDQSSKGKLKRDFRNVMRKLEEELQSIGDSLNSFIIHKEDTTGINPLEGKDSSEYRYRIAQATLVSPIGTNGLESDRTVNNLSLNFAGRSAGLDGFEVGFLYNGEKDFVKGAQVSGLCNVVGGEVKGAQVACLLNSNGGFTQGFQVAGLLNLVSDTVFAFQAAGFMNIVSKEFSGTQFSGFANIVNGNAYGPQFAGFTNITRGEMQGTQFAGFTNITPSGIIGTQVAGFSNVARDTLRGTQIAGFANVAKIVKGSQIGFINIADSVSGAQIGFFSFSRKGYRRVELLGSEVLHGGIAFKTGTSHLYNIFSAAANIKGNTLTWAGGYGLGSEFKLSNRTRLNLDALCYYVHNENHRWEDVNLLSQLKLNLGVLIGERTSIFLGPTFNVSVSNHFNSESNTYGLELTPDWKFYNKTHEDNYNVSMWLGFNAGIRF